MTQLRRNRKDARSGGDGGGEAGSLLSRRMSPGGSCRGQAGIPSYSDDGGFEETYMAVAPAYDGDESAAWPAAPADDPGDRQAAFDEAEMVRRHSEGRRAEVKARVARAAQYMFIALCLYMGFLIYGALVTHYDYDPVTGELSAQTMSVSELAAADEFRAMQAFYLRSRWLYEETLRLDYRLSSDPGSALVIATGYEVLLEDVAKLSVDLNAAAFSPAYNQLHAMLLNWVRTDTAVYLQNISAAITQNSQERAGNAVISREIMYLNFLVISENIAMYGRSVKGVSLGDVFEWSPERFVREELEGIRDGG